MIGVTSALAGCAGGGSSASNSFASLGNGPTVTFESIDGPPPQVFARMVSLLDAESKTRNLSIVSRETQAAYRIRSYLSAQVSRGRTTIAWVWDVYDRDGQRALRLSGEEAVSKLGHDRSGRDAWTAADDGLLRRIAQSGLAGLIAISGAGAVEPPSAPIPPRGDSPAIAGTDSPRVTAALSFSAD